MQQIKHNQVKLQKINGPAEGDLLWWRLALFDGICSKYLRSETRKTEELKIIDKLTALGETRIAYQKFTKLEIGEADEPSILHSSV